MTDQIADLLIRIKNASKVGKYEIEMPYSKMKEAILKILVSEGFVKDYEIITVKSIRFLKIRTSEAKLPVHIKQISTPGHRIYLRAKRIKTPLRGFGLAIVSTSKGVISAREANKIGVGGELICEIW